MTVAVYPLGTESPVNVYVEVPAQLTYGFLRASFTHSAASRASASAVASFRWRDETVIDVIKPPRIAVKVTETMTIVIRISASEKPSSSCHRCLMRMALADRHLRAARNLDVLGDDSSDSEGRTTNAESHVRACRRINDPDRRDSRSPRQCQGGGVRPRLEDEDALVLSRGRRLEADCRRSRKVDTSTLVVDHHATSADRRASSDRDPVVQDVVASGERRIRRDAKGGRVDTRAVVVAVAE